MEVSNVRPVALFEGAQKRGVSLGEAREGRTAEIGLGEVRRG